MSEMPQMGVNAGPDTGSAESAASSNTTLNSQNIPTSAGEAANVQSPVNPEQSESGQVQPEISFEKAFAARLAKERSKLEQQYSRHINLVKRAAADNGMSEEEYVEAVSKQYEEKDFEGVSPAIADDLKYLREMKQKDQLQSQEAQEKAKWENEVKSFYEQFQGIQAKDIPDEVFETRVRDGVPLAYAYAMYKLGKERTEIEQQVLKNIQNNRNATPGSLTGPATSGKQSVSQMSDKDFAALKQAVLRGEIKNL